MDCFLLIVGSVSCSLSRGVGGVGLGVAVIASLGAVSIVNQSTKTGSC